MIKKVADQVKEILENSKEARNSDRILYYLLLQRVDESMLDVSVKEFLLYADHVPNFESVRRSRQKVQEKYPELRASDKVQDYKYEREKEFMDFAVTY